MKNEKEESAFTRLIHWNQLQAGHFLGRRSGSGCPVGNAGRRMSRLLGDAVHTGERQLLVLLHRVQPEVFRIEIEHGEDQDDWRIDTQLPTLPQMRLAQSGRQRLGLSFVDGFEDGVVEGHEQCIQLKL